MLFVAAMLAGLGALQLALSPDISPSQLAASAACVALAGLFALRLGCADREGASLVLHSVTRLALAAAQVPRKIAEAVRAARGALSPAALRPALVRVRTRAGGVLRAATFATAASAVPGAIVVETDAEGVLLHALDEDALDLGALSALEAQIAHAIDGRAA